MKRNTLKTLLITIGLAFVFCFAAGCSSEDNTSSSIDTSSKGGIILENGGYSAVTYWRAVDKDTGLAYYSAITYSLSIGASSATLLVPGNKNYYVEYRNGTGSHYTQSFTVTTGNTIMISVY